MYDYPVSHLFTVICAFLPELKNGRMTSNDPSNDEGYYLDAVVLFSCNSGYVLVGASSTTCRGDRTNASSTYWDQPSPTCVGNELTRSLFTFSFPLNWKIQH